MLNANHVLSPTSLQAFIAPPSLVPETFVGPFNAQTASVPEIIQHAVDEWFGTVQDKPWYTELQSLSEGKMFGVLVVRAHEGIGYLLAYSGKLQQDWCLPGFVPPIFDVAKAEGQLATAAADIDLLDKAMSMRRSGSDVQATAEAMTKAREHAAREVSERKQELLRRKNERQRRRQNSPTESETLDLDRQSQHDRAEFRRLKRHWSVMVTELENKTNAIATEMSALEQQRKRISQQAQARHFDLYDLINSTGSRKKLSALFEPEVPPGGAGDCAAPKLLQFAYVQGWKPIALAEFWLGKSSATGVRHHRRFYPPCRARCAPILSFMMPSESPHIAERHAVGLVMKDCVDKSISPQLEPTVLLEDNDVLVLEKPAGLLSVPGKSVRWSVYEWLRQHFPDATGALLVHRLDMDTSGLMIAAKSSGVHKALQRQFLRRTVKKRYTALLDGVPAQEKGIVKLPLRVDLDDRPRQLVCRQYGKSAETRFEVIRHDQKRVRVHFYPLTGRTHQLRVHAAHHEGLGAPITGDPLYGFAAERLHLHADSFEFCHPQTQQRISVCSPVPF